MLRRTTALLALGALALTACATATPPLPPASGASGTGAPPAVVAPQAASAVSPAPERRTVDVDGRTRPYLLDRPPVGDRVLGAVLVAHAQNQTMGAARDSYRLEHLPRRGQLVAYLGGYRGSWNSGGCCGAPRAEGVDDLGYVREVFADLQSLLPRGATTAFYGYSTGGMLAYSVVCHADLPLKLVVSVSGTRSAGCGERARLPYRFIELHGGRDTTIPLDPPARFVKVMGITPKPTRPATRLLAEVSGCTRTVRRTHRTDDGGCRAGGVVRLLERPQSGHQYSDLDGPFVLTRALEEVGQIP